MVEPTENDMIEAECPEHPGCRESLICKINKKLGIKTFWTGLSAAVGIIGVVAMLSYGAYAGRMQRLEASQCTQDAKVEKQGEAIQRIDKTVEKIQTRQEIVIENQNDLKIMLRTLIGKEVNGGSRHDRLGTN